MPVLVKALGYLSYRGGKEAKGLSKLTAHLKYLEYGKEHPNEPRGFSNDREELSRADFLEVVQKQPERGVIAHKLVFSLSQDERDQLGIDMRQLVRSAMDDWSSRLGRPLKWIGFEHLDQGHPHVHVVVAGYAGDKQVGVYERDLRSLRESTEREMARHRDLERALPARGLGPRPELELERFAREFEHVREVAKTRQVREVPSRDSGKDRGR